MQYTTDNHYSQHIFVHAVSQHSKLVISHASSIPTGDSREMCYNFPLSVPINHLSLLLQYILSVFFSSLSHVSVSPITEC